MIDDKLNKQGFLDNGIFINKSGAHMLSDGKIAFSTEYGLSDVPSVSFDESYSLCYEGEKGNINLVVGRKKCKWIPCSDMLPDDEEKMVLVQVSGKYENITFEDALEIASYSQKEGWILEAYPEFEGAHPIAWMPLPEPYKEG